MNAVLEFADNVSFSCKERKGPHKVILNLPVFGYRISKRMAHSWTKMIWLLADMAWCFVHDDSIPEA